jgi:hypothetical protein
MATAGRRVSEGEALCDGGEVRLSNRWPGMVENLRINGSTPTRLSEFHAKGWCASPLMRSLEKGAFRDSPLEMPYRHNSFRNRLGGPLASSPGNNPRAIGLVEFPRVQGINHLPPRG